MKFRQIPAIRTKAALVILLLTAATAPVPAQQSAPAPGASTSREDALARQAIISALSGNTEGIQQAYWNSQGRPTGGNGITLSDAITYLYNSTRTNRDEFLSGQEILAANAKDKNWRNRILLSLLSDEAYELNRLEGQNRFNKHTRIFNRVSTSLSQLVMLQPQAAASLLWDGIYSIREGKSATVKERKMLYLTDQFLKKYPNAPERAEVEALRSELKQKMLTDRAKALLGAGRTALAEGKFQLAEWHLEKASLMNPAEEDTRTLLENARTLKIRSEEVRALTLGVSDAESRLAPDQARVIGDIARNLATGNISRVDTIRNEVPHVRDSVDYGYAAISERQGDHQTALTRLRNVALSAPNSPGGRAATKLLDNPNYNLNESYQAALADMASEKSKFIWTGRRTKDETVYAGGSAVISSAGNPVAVPALFGMDAAVRAISEKFKTQVSVDGVIDAGARYLRKYPDSPRRQEIARQLADLAKKAGDHDRTLEYLEEGGGGTPQELAKINENKAIAIVDQVKNSPDLLQRRRLLQELMEKYPETKIAQKSGKTEIAKLPPALAEDTIILPGSSIKRDPQLARFLGVPDALLDSRKNNGELTDEGVAITPSADAVEFKVRGENQWRRGALIRDGRDWVLTAARLCRQEYMATEEGQAQFYRQKAPFAIKGGVGSEGVDMAPQILPYETSRQDRKRFQ